MGYGVGGVFPEGDGVWIACGIVDYDQYVFMTAAGQEPHDVHHYVFKWNPSDGLAFPATLTEFFFF